MNVGPVGCLNVTLAAVAACLGLAASKPALAQQAVQWRVEDGGNGHWYRYVSAPRAWQAARAFSESVGGHLLTVSSDAESLLVRSLGSDTCWIGLFQNAESSSFAEPAGGWEWVTGEPIGFTHWRININGQPNEPNDLGGGENWAHLDGNAVTWNDLAGGVYPFAVEWSADCDGDGIVDYGEILDGTLADTNANGVPDCCDAGVSCDPCPGDLNQSNTVDAEDLAYILFAWGTDGGKTPEADITRDGTVNANDLSVVLGSWGPCPN
jgi:hypothetical protein